MKKIKHIFCSIIFLLMVTIIWVRMDTQVKKILFGAGIMLIAIIEWLVPFLKVKLRERRIKKIARKNWERKHHIGEKNNISPHLSKEEWQKNMAEIAREEFSGLPFFS